jgi:hypothetical protein
VAANRAPLVTKLQPNGSLIVTVSGDAATFAIVRRDGANGLNWEDQVMRPISRLALTVTFLASAVAAISSAQAQGPRGPFLVLGRCPPDAGPLGAVGFRNVGRNDRNEGARNYIRISLCSYRPRPLTLVSRRSDCPGRIISRTRFQNVANNDFNEGAPNFVRLGLCQTGPLRRQYLISTRGCPPQMRTQSVVRFKNVGNRDFNEGAPNFVAIALCRGFRQ